MCFPSDQYDDLMLRKIEATNEAKDAPFDSGDFDLSRIPASLRSAVEEAGGKREEAREKEAVSRLDLSPVDPNPFAVFGPRLGVQRISDVKPGEQGKKVSVSDLKIGLT